MKLSNIRKITVLLFVVLAVAALALHSGTGNLSSLGWDAIAYICPLGGIESMLASLTFIPRPFIALVVLVVLAFVLGKVFCAWVCPIPPIKRFFNMDAWRAFFKPKEAKEITGSASDVSDGSTTVGGEEVSLSAACSAETCATSGCSSCAQKRKKLDSRHVVLGGALLSTAAFGFPVFCLVCPVGLVFATIVAWWRFVGFAELTITLVVFPAILLFEVLVLRKWCLKFCPLGAVMSLMSIPNRFFRPKVNMEKCLRGQGVECAECVNVCEERLDPHYADGMHECTKCGMCMEHCPAQAISIPFASKQNKPDAPELPETWEAPSAK